MIDCYIVLLLIIINYSCIIKLLYSIMQVRCLNTNFFFVERILQLYHITIIYHLLSIDCNVVSQLKMVSYGCTTEGMHYATHFGRRNTKFFSVKSYNITQQSSTFDGNNKTMLFTTKKGQLRLYDRGTALRNAIWVS